MSSKKLESKAVQQLYQRLSTTGAGADRISCCAHLILAIFDDFYEELCEYPFRAKKAFEDINPVDSVAISHERLGLYSGYILVHGPRVKQLMPELETDTPLWDSLMGQYEVLIAARYEADIAYGFAHSLRRNIYHGEWRPVAYSFSTRIGNRYMSRAQAHQRFDLTEGLTVSLMCTVLQIPRFKAPFEDLDRDAESIVQRWKELEKVGEIVDAKPVALETLECGFFRDLTAFLVGRIEWEDGLYTPFVLALLNGDHGIYVEALLHQTSDVHNLFSSTLANFHVTNPLYYQTCVFLYSLMPLRPLGLHYSTIGFNHVGKVAILRDIQEQLNESTQQFASSPGYDGTVAIGFTFDNCLYHLKVIRDTPTKQYKWGDFAGVEAVLDKYKTVHEINRTGSMLDNVMYFNLKLSRQHFDQDLLEDLAEQAGQSVQVGEEFVLFKALIVQLKIIPLTVYFEQASGAQLDQVMENLGYCIMNNMAANIFNKDLDVRNYGVGRYNKVFLFDYDAVEKLTDITLDTNVGKEDGEEDIPDWFFSDQYVFLPEELESGLQIPDRNARRYFSEYHSDLLTLEFWQNAQQRLQQGEVLGLRSYPDTRKLEKSVDDSPG